MSDWAAVVIAAGVLLLQVLTFRRQGKTDAKVETIAEHTNGLVEAAKKAAYDRGAADEQAGDAAPKADAP